MRMLRALLYVAVVLCAAAFADVCRGDAPPPPPAVIWYAPLLSGGGYCSEAHSYVTSIAAALRSMEEAAVDEQDGSTINTPPHSHEGSSKGSQAAVSSTKYVTPFSLLVTQHGDSLNAAFIRDIPDSMHELLKEVSLLLPPLSWLFRMYEIFRMEWMEDALTRVYAFVSHFQHWIEERDFNWRLSDRKIAIAICHSEPGAWHPARYTTSRCPPKGALYKVGRTMFETDRVPSGWPERMNNMDEIWVPTRFQEHVFIEGRVRAEAIKVVPEAVDVDFFNPEQVETPYDLASELAETGFTMTEHTTVYLSIFKWEERKAWRVLIKAYFEAFAPEDDVVLVLLTNAYHVQSETAKDFLEIIDVFAREAVGKTLKKLPKLHVLPPHLPQTALPSLYKAATAFVLPSRGEGWGRPHVEAMAMELPVIATFWSGTTEYMTEENSYRLRIDGLVEITEGAFSGHKWAEPSIDHLKELLVHVKQHPEEAIAKGKRARQDMIAKYAPDIIGDLILGHIHRILKEVARRQEQETDNSEDHDEL